MDLMKTGRPMYRLPSPATVARDVKHVFISMRSIIVSKLKVSTYFTVHVADLIPKSQRHTMVVSTSQPTHGPPPMDEHSLQ